MVANEHEMTHFWLQNSIGGWLLDSKILLVEIFKVCEKSCLWKKYRVEYSLSYTASVIITVSGEPKTRKRVLALARMLTSPILLQIINFIDIVRC